MNPRFVGQFEFTFEPSVKGPVSHMFLLGDQIGIYRPNDEGGGTLDMVYTLCRDGVARIVFDGTPAAGELE